MLSYLLSCASYLFVQACCLIRSRHGRFDGLSSNVVALSLFGIVGFMNICAKLTTEKVGD